MFVNYSFLSRIYSLIIYFIYSRNIEPLADLDSEALSMSDSEVHFIEVQLSSSEVISGDVPVSVRGRLVLEGH